MAVQAKDLPASAVVERTRKLSFIEWLTPRWGRQAALQVEGYVSYSFGMAFACGAMALVVFGVGVGMLFGDGFATIQGVRYTLRAFGLAVRVDDFPPLKWWTIQVVLVFIQVFAKKFKGLRVLWTPSYVFNAATTSVFIGIALGGAFGVSYGITPELVVGTSVVALIGSFLGHILALGAEQVTLTGLCMLGAVFTGLLK